MTAVGAGRIIPHPFARCTATPKTEFHHTPKPSSSTPPNRHPPRPTPVILHACGGSVLAASSALNALCPKVGGPREAGHDVAVKISVRPFPALPRYRHDPLHAGRPPARTGGGVVQLLLPSFARRGGGGWRPRVQTTAHVARTHPRPLPSREGRIKQLTLFLVCDLCALMVQARRDQCRELVYTA